MRIGQLNLVNFRSYPRLQLQLDPGLNFFWGANGAGKTNILEAIYMLGTTRSPRTSRDADLVGDGGDSYHISAEVERNGSLARLELFYQQGAGKGARINGVTQSRVSDVLGNLNAVFFSPDDLSLLKGSPAGRRSFLDDQLSQVDPPYYRELARYARALRQRNGALRDRVQAAVVEVFDAQLAESGARLLAARVEAVGSLGPSAAGWVERLSAGSDRLAVAYSSPLAAVGDDVETIQGRMLEALRRARPEELRRGYTLVGPHRDDLLLEINGADARSHASQGQQRTVALALKLQQMDFVGQRRGLVPLLLLDDVLSELDQSRRTVIIDHLPLAAQTLVTSTDSQQLGAARSFVVAPGQVTAVAGGE